MELQNYLGITETSLSDNEKRLYGMQWNDLYKEAMPLVKKLSKQELSDKIIEVFPLATGQEYVGSIANHYRGRLKNEGVDSLMEQMCSNSLRRIILALS